MNTICLPGDPDVEVTLRRSARARRMSLRVSRLDGRVTLTCPHGVRESDVTAFVRDKEAWMRKHIAKKPPVCQVGIGSTVPFRGVDHRIQSGVGRRTEISDGVIFLPRGAAPGRRLAAWMKVEARTRLASASDTYAATLGRSYTRLALRDTRSRWGSCSATGTLSYSWRLVMAPPEVLDYVAAHEVAHLVEMNHSQAFWRVVERLKPDFETPRRWLRTDGPSLHHYRFDQD